MSNLETAIEQLDQCKPPTTSYVGHNCSVVHD
jgi:hypothetical protein